MNTKDTKSALPPFGQGPQTIQVDAITADIYLKEGSGSGGMPPEVGNTLYPVGSMMAICQDAAYKENVAPYEALKRAGLIRDIGEFVSLVSTGAAPQ